VNPYADTLDHLQDELRRIDLLLQLHFNEVGGGEPDEGFEGMYISDEEVARLLQEGRERRAGVDEALRGRIEDLTTRIRERVAASRRNGVRLRLAILSENFGLSAVERDALLLALAPEVDGKYERIYSYLLDDITETRPTVGLVLGLLSGTERERLGSLSVFAPSGTLREERLVRLTADTEGMPRLTRSVYVDRHVVDFLFGGESYDDAIAEYVRFEPSTAQVSELRLDPETRDRLTDVVAAVTDEPTVYYFHGPTGSGRADAAEAVAAALDVPRLCVDTSAMADEPVEDAFELLQREATLYDAALQFDDVDALVTEETGLDELTHHFDAIDGQVFLTGEQPWTPSRKLAEHGFTTVDVKRPPFSLRKEIWAEYDDQLPDSVDTDELASKFSLTRGQIEDALFAARAHTNGHGLTRDAVYRGCRAQSSGTLEDLARKTDTNYTWDDIVLPGDKKKQLREVEAHVKHRGTVYSQWGFDEKFSLGNGLSVLFTGPSGTGKTMAAEIIASTAGLDLYKIDIASVVSKYIGETEENLGAIFDEAEHSNAILFFDEADALFGQRSEVSNAQDRYANVEVNYLLQRVEEHDGTVILTTNFEQNIDDAFLRRLDVSVTFPRPDEASRLAIWKHIFPEATPVGDIDYEFLSTFDVTGGNIKNIAQTAAFLAADDAGVVEMEHVVMATKLELQKIGKLVNPSDFGRYRDLLAR
jgi:AAA+ superfamily predicted ATPase